MTRHTRHTPSVNLPALDDPDYPVGSTFTVTFELEDDSAITATFVNARTYWWLASYHERTCGVWFDRLQPASREPDRDPPALRF